MGQHSRLKKSLAESGFPRSPCPGCMSADPSSLLPSSSKSHCWTSAAPVIATSVVKAVVVLHQGRFLLEGKQGRSTENNSQLDNEMLLVS